MIIKPTPYKIWVIALVVSGMCGGVTGLYTGYYMALQKQPPASVVETKTASEVSTLTQKVDQLGQKVDEHGQTTKEVLTKTQDLNAKVEDLSSEAKAAPSKGFWWWH